MLPRLLVAPVLALLTLGLARPAFAEEPIAEPPAAPAVRPPSARVHLVAPPDVGLVVLDGPPATVCKAPCDVDVPLDATYRIQGPTIRTSKAFRLHALPGDRVVLEVDPTSAGTHEAGMGTLVVGGVVAVVGVGLVSYIGFAALLCLDSGGGACPLPNSTAALDGIAFTGFGMMGAGTLVALTGGLVALSSTTVEQRSAPAGGARDDRWLRSPTWRTAPEPSLAPAATAVPLFSRAF